MKNHPHLFASPNRAYSSRRDFLRLTGSGFGMLALSALMDQHGAKAASVPNTQHPTPNSLNPLAPHPGHFPARAKSVIWLFMNGGPSQVDTWDYKPELAKHDGQELKGFDKDTGFFVDQVGPIMKSPFKFAQHGQSGTWASEIFPGMAQHVDDMAFIHSCYTETNNHSPALFEINTGMNRMGFPSVGAWVTYGLGSVKPESARFRGDVRYAGARPAQRLRAELGRGLSARRVSGNRAERAGRAHQQPGPRRPDDGRAAARPTRTCWRN